VWPEHRKERAPWHVIFVHIDEEVLIIDRDLNLISFFEVRETFIFPHIHWDEARLPLTCIHPSLVTSDLLNRHMGQLQYGHDVAAKTTASLTNVPPLPLALISTQRSTEPLHLGKYELPANGCLMLRFDHHRKKEATSVLRK
jgi:hypothetical protein